MKQSLRNTPLGLLGRSDPPYVMTQVKVFVRLRVEKCGRGQLRTQYQIRFIIIYVTGFTETNFS